MFLRVRRVFTVCVCVGLVCLFTLPGLFLYTKGQQLFALSEELDKYLLAENAPSAMEKLTEVEGVFYPMETRAEAFLHHEAVDECTLSLSTLRVRIENEDLLTAREALQEFTLALQHIISIEVFDWRMFL